MAAERNNVCKSFNCQLLDVVIKRTWDRTISACCYPGADGCPTKWAPGGLGGMGHDGAADSGVDCPGAPDQGHGQRFLQSSGALFPCRANATQQPVLGGLPPPVAAIGRFIRLVPCFHRLLRSTLPPAHPDQVQAAWDSGGNRAQLEPSVVKALRSTKKDQSAANIGFFHRVLEGQCQSAVQEKRDCSPALRGVAWRGDWLVAETGCWAISPRCTSLQGIRT